MEAGGVGRGVRDSSASLLSEPDELRRPSHVSAGLQTSRLLQASVTFTVEDCTTEVVCFKVRGLPLASRAL